jgi:hypothetical protein
MSDVTAADRTAPVAHRSCFVLGSWPVQRRGFGGISYHARRYLRDAKRLTCGRPRVELGQCPRTRVGPS